MSDNTNDEKFMKLKFFNAFLIHEEKFYCCSKKVLYLCGLWRLANA